MHFVFIYPSPGGWGGIETQMTRMSRWLLTRGHQVTVIAMHDDKWATALPEGVRCIALRDHYWDLLHYSSARRLWESWKLPRVDVVKTFSWGELRTVWIGYLLSLIADAKAVTGMYGPRLMMKDHFHPDFYLHSYLHDIPTRGRIFMSPEQIEDMEERYGRGGELWPLPVDSTQFIPAERRPVWGRLVSIGRLDEMKEYNLYMIEVVDELRRRGHAVSWTAHGAGKYEAEMREMIRARGLDDVITLAGAMPYAQCRQVLAEAYAFVGMGTTVLEASLFGVPNVLATAYDRTGITYGPIYRVSLGSVGDTLRVPPKLQVVDEIERLLRMSPEEYAAEAERVKTYARPYESDLSMQRLLDIIAAAPKRHRWWSVVRHVARYQFGPWMRERAQKGRKLPGRVKRKIGRMLAG